MDPTTPTMRWGVLGTGMISTMFASDIIAPRPNAPVKHLITALGTSTQQKGNSFVSKIWGNSKEPRPVIYDDYKSVYADKQVDIVYVGTPHSLHRQNCLDAIAAGKHVLCEKPLTINAREAKEVIDAARAKGVALMEAVWTRFFPCVQELQKHLHEHKSIGDIRRAFIEYGAALPISSLGPESRLRDPALGAGALLDIGMYTLMYASVIMGQNLLGTEHPVPEVISAMSITDGIDESNVNVLTYADGTRERVAVCTSTLLSRGPKEFARIEGSEGSITLHTAKGPSCPTSFVLKRGGEETKFAFENPPGTAGFVFEADSFALDVLNGRLENQVMPLDETLRMMALMDGIRDQGGLKYPQDQ